MSNQYKVVVIDQVWQAKKLVLKQRFYDCFGFRSPRN
jgi:hypothetical protein